MSKNIFAFDVEAHSLHGTGFAVGAVVMNPQMEIIDEFQLMATQSIDFCSDWVKENVLPHLEKMPKTFLLLNMREKFYEFYLKHKETCEIWVDCGYPVETNFLSTIVDYDLKAREFQMPFPLLDLATIIGSDLDRINFVNTRLNIKLQKHNPLDDAKATAYLVYLTTNFKSRI